HVAQIHAQRARVLCLFRSRFCDLDCKTPEIRHAQRLPDKAAVRVRIRSHAALALGRESFQLGTIFPFWSNSSSGCLESIQSFSTRSCSGSFLTPARGT